MVSGRRTSIPAHGREAPGWRGHGGLPHAGHERAFIVTVEREMENSIEMLAGGAGSPADHVAKMLRGYLSSHHALHPESGCALPALGAEIARSGPEVRSAVERSLRRLQRR